MSTVTTLYGKSYKSRLRGRSPAPSPTTCPPVEAKCTNCGQLECLCRPRFFAGQVLTADDLNRLDHYIRGKHRLQNRHLHGWGVVNGLEVTCDPCGEGVVVGCGYALSPCGEDIVVCDGVMVDVCALIQECKDAERAKHPCGDTQTPNVSSTCEGAEEWVLAIRYAEAPTRGVKPLLPLVSPTCGCSEPVKTCGCASGASARGKCSCGGVTASVAKGCGCGATTAKKPRSAPAQCEPTVVCEGYAFEVYRKPPAVDPGSNDDNGLLALNPESELIKRFKCCWDALVVQMPKMPGTPTLASIQANTTVWQQWTCTFKEFLQAYLASKPGYSCELLAQLNTVSCPPATGQGAALAILQTLFFLVVVWLDAILACLCSSLLPPCPEPSLSGCVPIATLRISSKPCRVVSICNWTRLRKFATTFPSLQYWLGIFPYVAQIRKMLESMCCSPILQALPTDPRGDNVATHGMPAAAPEGEQPAPPPYYERATRKLNPRVPNPERIRSASRLAQEAFTRGESPLDPQVLFESFFLRSQDKGEGHLSPEELANVPQMLLMSQIARPLGLEALGSLLGAIGGGGGGKEETVTTADDVDALRDELATLRGDLSRQAEEIRRLKEAGKKKKEK